MAFEIKKAVRVQQPILIGLWGGPSSGKTYSALRIATGLVEPGKKIAFIDTENRRGLVFADIVKCEYDHIDFTPPYTPKRYIEALNTLEHAGGYGCVIIDSGSHVWKGEGGVVAQAESVDPKKGLARWKNPKLEHAKLLDAILRYPSHIILCLRSHMGVAQITNKTTGKIEIVETGLVPIAEKTVIHEMMVSIALGPNKCPLVDDIDKNFWVNPRIPRIKLPPKSNIEKTISSERHLDEDTGRAIREWISGGTRDIRDEARRVAIRGTPSLESWFKGLSREDKAIVTTIGQELRVVATKADEDAAKPEELVADQDGTPAQGYVEDPFVSSDQSPRGDDPFLSSNSAISGPDTPPIKTTTPVSTPVQEDHNSIEAFKKELSRMDWTYQMSDDHRAYKEGENRERQMLSKARAGGNIFQRAYNDAYKKAFPDAAREHMPFPTVGYTPGVVKQPTLTPTGPATTKPVTQTSIANPF